MADDLARLQRVLPSTYTIERELGRGGMATVYLADDAKHHRRVAIKVLHADYAGAIGRARFHREIEIAATLSHPAILPLFDSGDTDDVVYYVMPYVEGESLRDLLEREIQLPLERVLRIAREVADALAYAHGHDVIHRDIKPANILLTSGHAVVADFGVARAVWAAAGELSTSKGIAVGTPPYMSPEQWSAGVVDRRTDVWALGCVVYEMLAGTPPFTGATPDAIRARAQNEPPPSLEVVRPGVGRAMEAVVERALAKVPADRWQTATDFVDALEEAAQAPESAGYLPVRERVRRRWRKVGVGAAAVVAVAGALALWRPWAPRVLLDANKVAGFPLLARGGVTRDVAEQVYTVIENAFIHTEPLQWVPGSRWIARGGAEPATVSADLASPIARRLGARYWITGSVTAAGDSVSVALELYDARGDSLVDRSAAAGPTLMPAYTLGLRAVNALLPKIVGRSTHVDQQVLAGFSQAAVVHWLAGERAYREARYDSALAYYDRALGEDSGMVFAALKGAMASVWSLDAEGYPRAERLVRVALAHEARLPRRNAAFAHGMSFLFEGDGDSALAWFRKAVAADSAWSEGWYGVGEAYLHLSPSGTAQDSLARDAYSRSLALAPDFAPVAFHLAEIALLAGDRRGADSLVAIHRRLSADSAQLVTLDILRMCTQSGPSLVAWRQLAERYPAEVFDAARLLAGGARFPRCARAGFEATLAVPTLTWSAMGGLHHLAVAAGDTARARGFVDSIHAAGGSMGTSALGFTILDAVAGLQPDARAAPALALLTAPRRDTVAFLVWIGEWAAHTRDAARLDSIAAALRRRGAGAPAAHGSALAAWAVLARGDTAAALTRFAELHPVGSVSKLAFDFWAPQAVERLQYARLLLARGEYRRAIEVAASFDRGLSLVDLVFLPASLQLRSRAARELGDEAAVRRYAERSHVLQRPPS